MKSLPIYINEYIIKNKLDKPIDSEHTYKYIPNTKEELVENIEELVDRDIYDFNCIDTSKITDMSHLFNVLNKRIKYNLKYTPFDVSGWDVSNVTNMAYTFFNCYNFDCDLSNWNVSKVDSMLDMFANCKMFTGKGLENWNVSNVENMAGMFSGCVKFNCDISKWNVSNVTSMMGMFSNCWLFSCDLSKWNVSKVKDMESMFAYCYDFTGKGLENWNVSNVKHMNNMFFNCKVLNCDLNNWNVSKVTNTYDTFKKCLSLKNTPRWYKK